MTIEEIIKEAFSKGWNASHECATDFDFEYALRNCLSEMEGEVKKFRLGAVIESLPEHECKYCGVMTTQPDEECYKAPLHSGNVL